MGMWKHYASDPVGIFRLSFLPQFKLNVLFVKDKHSIAHVLITAALVISLNLLGYRPDQSFWYAFILMLLWDIGDGFKKGWWQAPKGTSWVVENFWYSDGFSWSDVFVFNLGGGLLGVAVINFLY